MAQFGYVCYACGVEASAPEGFVCPSCGGFLSILSKGVMSRAALESPPRTMWHYGDLLPIAAPARAISIGEGATPLIDAPNLSSDFGARITLKLECANPTGSFKDRQISVGITRARELGMDTVAVVSSGNVACAAAAYAARAGMRAVLLMHGLAGPGKTAQAAAYGAEVVCVDGPPSATFDLCLEACQEFGWYHLSTAGIYEPFNVEGAKTIAYELWQQTGGDLPEWIVAPVGGGGLLGGLWRGFLDLKRLGLVERLPKLVGVQAAGCAPLVQAIDEDLSAKESLARPWPNPETIAGGIADDILFDVHTVLPAIRETGGRALAVTDDEIIAGELLLARREGVLAEPTCAVVVAALDHLRDTIGDTRVCCIVTGAGVKELNAIQDYVAKPKRIAANLDALHETLGVRT